MCLRRKSFYLSNTKRRRDSIATSSERMHLNAGFFWNSKERPDVLLRRPDGCNLELFETSRHWCESGRNNHVVRMNVADWWVSGRYTGPSERKLRIRLLWIVICTESSLNFWSSLFEACDTATVIIKLFTYHRNKLWISEDSEIYGILMKATTLHDSDFVNRMQPIKN